MPHTAFITGGPRGIGLGIPRARAAEGWRLALCGQRAEADVTESLDSLRRSGVDLHYSRADIGVSDDRARLLDDVLSRFGTVEALVNNAGRAPRVRADLLDATEVSFEEVLRTNLQGPYFLTQAVARTMTNAKARDASARGAIVFITSVSAEMASPNRGEYC